MAVALSCCHLRELLVYPRMFCCFVLFCFFGEGEEWGIAILVSFCALKQSVFCFPWVEELYVCRVGGVCFHCDEIEPTVMVVQ